MAEEGQAGASAGQRAAELREQAARLEAEAANWDRGSEGERLTRELLAPLIKDGFQLLDDLAIPDSKANVDHVVIGPAGVFVIDTKNYSGQLNIGKDMIWRGRYPLRREVDTLLWETQQVELAASRALPTWTLGFRSVLCVHGGLPAGTRAAVAGVDVVSPDMLTGLLAEGPNLLTQSHMLAAAIALKKELPPRTAATVPSAPARRPRGSVPSRSRPSTSYGTRSRYPSAPPSRRSAGVRPRSGSPSRRDEGGGTAQGADRPGRRCCLADRRQGHLRSATNGAAKAAVPAFFPTEPQVATTTTKPPPPPLLTFTCPAPGKGWELHVTWQANNVPGSSWEATTAPTSSGPWTVRFLGGGQDAAALLGGFPPTMGVFVKAGPGVLFGGPVAETSATSPPTPC